MGQLRFGRTGAGLFRLHRGGGRHAGSRIAAAATATAPEPALAQARPLLSAPADLPTQTSPGEPAQAILPPATVSPAAHPLAATQQVGPSSADLPVEATRPAPQPVRPDVAVQLGFSDGSAVTLRKGDPWARALCGVADEIARRRSGVSSGV